MSILENTMRISSHVGVMHMKCPILPTGILRDFGICNLTKIDIEYHIIIIMDPAIAGITFVWIGVLTVSGAASYLLASCLNSCGRQVYHAL